MVFEVKAMFVFDNVAYDSIVTIEKLNINRNEITCLVGPSGGGKSTILKMMNKSISPTEGTIRYEETPLAEIDSVEHRRRVIYLSQSPYIFEGTIKDNLQVGLLFHGKEPADEKTLESMLRRVSLDKPLDADASNLSGGEAQRLALGRVLLLEGDCYLMDEPSSALDDETEKLIIRTIADFVKRNKKTLVMITHSRSIAEEYADHIYEIKAGKVKGDKR